MLALRGHCQVLVILSGSFITPIETGPTLTWSWNHRGYTVPIVRSGCYTKYFYVCPVWVLNSDWWQLVRCANHCVVMMLTCLNHNWTEQVSQLFQCYVVSWELILRGMWGFVDLGPTVSTPVTVWPHRHWPWNTITMCHNLRNSKWTVAIINSTNNCQQIARA